MLSPTINDMILGLFDDASLGNEALFKFLKSLFQCQQVMLTSYNSEELAANDIYYKFDKQYFLDNGNLRYKHPDIHLNDKHPSQFLLTIDPEENLYLKVQFQSQECFRECLKSKDISTLIPYIQQASLIANKISQQQGDIHSVNYVLSHHPCNLLNQPLSLLPPNSSFYWTVHRKKEAANTDIHLEVDRDLLVQFFNLAPSETELAKLLFQGLSLAEIAEYRGVSKQTIRKQLQSILKKTQCVSQEALMFIIFDVLFTGLQKPKIKQPIILKPLSTI